MDYGMCSCYDNENADQPVIFSTNCALDMTLMPTPSLCVQDTFEVQIECHQNSPEITRYHSSVLDRPSGAPNDTYYTSGYDTQNSLEARRIVRRRISRSALERYSNVIDQLGSSSTLDVASSPRFRHHSPPTRLVCSPRIHLQNHEISFPNLDRCQTTVESAEVMTPEQKISSKRGEQEYVQKKTFTNWMNAYLRNANPPIKVDDLFQEIRDGVVLIHLLEVLSHENLPVNLAADMKPAYCLSNVKTALDFLASKKIKLVNINPVDIVDGRPKIVLGLIWSLILYFQIEEQEEMLLELLGMSKNGLRSKVTAKQALTTWVQNAFSERIERFRKFNIDIKDFGPSWRDGKAFNAIVHSIDPMLVDMAEVEKRSNRENLHQAFTVAEERLGIPKILDPEDVDVDRPDEKSIMTYVAQFYKAFPETGKPKTLNSDERDQRQFVEFLDALQQAESRITESIQMNEGFKEAYSVYTTTLEKAEKYSSFADHLRQKAEAGVLVGGKYSAQSGLDAFDHFEGRLKDWRWWLLERLPGDLRQTGRWMASVEKWMEKVDEQWSKYEEDGIPMPASEAAIEKLVEEQEKVLGPDGRQTATEASRLHKFLASSEFDQSTCFKLENTMTEITNKVDGYVVTIEASNCYRKVLNAFLKSNLGGCIDEWIEIITANRQNETLDLVLRSYKEFKNWDVVFNLSHAKPRPIVELTEGLKTVVQLEQANRPLACGMTSNVIGSWLQRTLDAFQPASLGEISLQEIGKRIEERIEAWNTYEEKLNEAVSIMNDHHKALQKNLLNIKKADLDRIEELIQDAGTAAGLLGTQAQLNSVEISRRQLEDLKAAVLAKKHEEYLINEAANEKIENVITRISEWNKRVQKLTSGTKGTPKGLQNKIAAIKEILAETKELDEHLQSIEHTRSSALAESKVEVLDTITMEFFQQERYLSEQLKNLEQTSAKADEIEGLLIRLESETLPLSKDINDLEEEFNQGLPQVTNLIKELENLLRSAPIQTYVHDLEFDDFKQRQGELLAVWKSRKAASESEKEARRDFEDACGRLNALLIELSRYFDAIETDLSSTNVEMVKGGVAVFEDLNETINQKLPDRLEALNRSKFSMYRHISEDADGRNMLKSIEQEASQLERRYKDLVDRKTAIERECQRAITRMEGFKDYVTVLKGVVEESKPLLTSLRKGPKIGGKSPQRDTEATESWYTKCEELARHVTACEKEASRLQLLLEDPDSKPPPGCKETWREYEEVHEEAMKLLTIAGNFKSNFTLFRDGAKEIELRLQELQIPVEKPWLGIRQSLHDTSTIDLSGRVEQIDNQLQVEARLMDVLQELKDATENIRITNLASEIVQVLEKELNESKMRVESLFNSLRAEKNEVSRNLVVQSEIENSFRGLDNWLDSMELQIRTNSPESTNIPENLKFLDEELHNLTNLYNELSTTGSQRVNSVLAVKGDQLGDSYKERKRQIKSRFDALFKAVSLERDKCLRSREAWKELDSKSKSCLTYIQEINGKMDKVEEGQTNPDVQSLEEAFKLASRRTVQNQKLLDDMSSTMGSLEKQIQQIQEHIQRKISMDVVIPDIESIILGQSKLQSRQETLLKDLQATQKIWDQLQETYKNYSQLLIEIETSLLSSCFPDYPNNPSLRQLKNISEIIDSLKLKEMNCAKALEDLKSSTLGKLNVHLTEMHRICAHLGGNMIYLLETEASQFEKQKLDLEEISSIQAFINENIEKLVTIFNRIRGLLEKTRSCVEELAKSRTPQSPDVIFSTLNGIRSTFDQEERDCLKEFASSVSDLQMAYKAPRKMPTFLNKLPESLAECFTETAKRLEKATLEANDKVKEIDDLYNRLTLELSDLEVQREKIFDLSDQADEANSEVDLKDIQKTVKDTESKYNSIVSRLKRILSQASKVKTSDRLNKITSFTITSISESQNKLDGLKGTLKQLSTRIDEFNKSLSQARDAVNANIVGLHQNVQFKPPIRDVADLKDRLDAVELLEEDLSTVEGTSSIEQLAFAKESLLPMISKKVNDVLQRAMSFSDDFADEALKPLHNSLKAYSELIERARESVEKVIDAASAWLSESNVVYDDLKKAFSDIKKADRIPDIDFDNSTTARMDGLNEAKDREKFWLPKQIHRVEKIAREASSIIVGGFSLSSIDEVALKMESIQNILVSIKSELVKVTLLWETRVSEEREIKQLSKMSEDLCNRFENDLDAIEPLHKYASPQEAEEMLSRLEFLKSQVPVGDELIGKIRSLSSSSPSIISTFSFISRWENLTKRLKASIEGLDKLIEEKTGKEKELLALQSWLNAFQRTIQQAMFDAQSSSDVSNQVSCLGEMKFQFSQWEATQFSPYLAKHGAGEQIGSLEFQKETVGKQIDQLEEIVKKNEKSQKAKEDRLKRISAEVDGVCSDLESRNFITPRNVTDSSNISEVCANLRENQKALKSTYEPVIENLLMEIYSLECDGVNNSTQTADIQKCRKKLEDGRKTLQMIDNSLTLQIQTWEEITGLARKIDDWMNEQYSDRRTERNDTSEVIATPIEAFSKHESHHNVQRLGVIAERRLSERNMEKRRLDSSRTLNELLGKIRSKADGVKECKNVLKAFIEGYELKVCEKVDELKSRWKDAEEALERADKIQMAVLNLDSCMLELNGVHSSVEDLTRGLESVQTIVETEIRQLVKDDYELRVQLSRAERVVLVIQNWIREKQAKDRNAASERESLKLMTSGIFDWLFQWRKSLGEVMKTADLELSIHLTSKTPSSNFHCLDNARTLHREFLVKRNEVEELLGTVSNKVGTERDKEEEELVDLNKKMASDEKSIGRVIEELTERLHIVEGLRECIYRSKEWIKGARMRLEQLKVFHLSSDSQDDSDPLNNANLQSTAEDLRHSLAQSLNLLQTSHSVKENTATPLLQVALTEVDKTDGEIEQLLTAISEAKASLTNYRVLAIGLEKSIHKGEEAVGYSATRVNELLIRCFGSGRRLRALSPLRSSTSRFAPQVERLMTELRCLDDLGWLDAVDMLVQELKFIEADVKMNATSFQSLADQSAVLQRDYSDISLSTQVDQLCQKNNRMLRACEELINHFNTVSSQCTRWNCACQDFVNWTEKLSSVLTRIDISFAKSLPTPKGLDELKKLQGDHSTGVAKQQAVADETQRLIVAVSRALHSLDATSALIPASSDDGYRRHGFSLSVNYRWHEAVLSAVGVMADLEKTIPTKIAEYEKSLDQWAQTLSRHTNLVSWLETAESKIAQSIQLIDNDESPEGDSILNQQLQEMRNLNEDVRKKKTELKRLENELLRIQSENTLNDTTNRLTTVEMRLKNHLDFLNDLQNLVDDFNGAAQNLESWMRRYESRRGIPMNVEEGISLLEHCRTIFHQLVICVNSRSRQRHHPRKLEDTQRLLEEFSAWKCTASSVLCIVIRRFQTLETNFGELTGSGHRMKSAGQCAVDWRYFHDLIRRTQVFLDENSVRLHKLLPTNGYEDVVNKLAFATSTLARLEDFSLQIQAAAKSLRSDEAADSSQPSLAEIERTVTVYDPAMVNIVTGTLSRLESSISTLKAFIEELRSLHDCWRRYKDEVDDLRNWFGRKDSPRRRDDIRKKLDRVKGLNETFRRLSGNDKPTDPDLQKLEADFSSLLLQLSRREPPERDQGWTSESETPRNLRAEVITNILNTVQHIKSDVEQADERRERSYFSRARSDWAWRTSTKAIRCHVCGRVDPSVQRKREEMDLIN